MRKLQSPGAGLVAEGPWSRLGVRGAMRRFVPGRWLLSIAGVVLAVIVSGGGAFAASPVTFVQQWGSWGNAAGQYEDPHGLAVVSAQNIPSLYVADTGNNRLQKFWYNGQLLQTFTPPGFFAYPSGVAVDGQGNVYVTNAGASSVDKFAANGTFLTAWGSTGYNPGQFRYPYGIAVDGAGNVYVADSENNRVEKFNSGGAFLQVWGAYGSSPGQFIDPRGIAVDGQGYVYVVDSGNNRVQKFTSGGGFVLSFGTTGTAPGNFQSPTGVAVDGAGYVYVTDTGHGYTANNRVEQFTTGGAFVQTWGSWGSAAGQFEDPSGIAVVTNAAGYDDIYVADASSRVQKFSEQVLYSQICTTCPKPSPPPLNP